MLYTVDALVARTLLAALAPLSLRSRSALAPLFSKPLPPTHDSDRRKNISSFSHIVATTVLAAVAVAVAVSRRRRRHRPTRSPDLAIHSTDSFRAQIITCSLAYHHSNNPTSCYPTRMWPTTEAESGRRHCPSHMPHLCHVHIPTYGTSDSEACRLHDLLEPLEPLRNASARRRGARGIL